MSGVSVSLSALAGDWQWAPIPLCAGALAVLLYASGVRRLRARGRPDLAPTSRALLFGAGIALALLALVSPLDRAGEDYLLSAHMLQHMILLDAAPALIVLGLCGPIALFTVPRPILRRSGRGRPLRRVAHILLEPWVSFGLWVAVMWSWHLPALYDAALGNSQVHDLEHASFIAVGLLAWIQIVDPARRRRLSPGRRAVFCVGLLVAGMALCEVLLVQGVLYSRYAIQPLRLLGLSPAADQNHAALIMMAEQFLTMGIAGAMLLWTHIEQVSGLAAQPSPAPPEVEASSELQRSA